MEIILHITDIHFGYDGTSIALKDSRKLWLKSLVNTIASLSADWKPTIICLTGDLVWRSTAPEYDEAKIWLDSLLNACCLSFSDVVMCAGNHEVNRNHADTIPRPADARQADKTLALPIKKYLEESFDNYIEFCKQTEIPSFTLGEYTSYLVGERKIRNLRFLALNTAWHSKDGEDQGKLWLGLPQLKHLEVHEQAPVINTNPHAPITIAIMHHPVPWLHKEEQHARTDARPNSIDYLAHRCDILLTGHTHGEVREPDRIAKAAHHFTGGATYAGDGYRNSFRLLQIEDNVVRYRAIESNPRSYDNKWVISEANFLTLRDGIVSNADGTSADGVKKPSAALDQNTTIIQNITNVKYAAFSGTGTANIQVAINPAAEDS